jgi:zinc protease
LKLYLAILFAVTGLAFGQAPSKLPPIKFTDTTLDNGLRVIIAEDHYAPVFAVAVSYKVGSRDERKGRTGFAHLFEHMMFKGSENVGPGEHFYLIFSKGGTMNGTTNNDRTLYYEVLPRNQLEMALYLEADRMKSLSVTPENLDNQRQAVKEERRLGIDNQPYGQSNEKVDELVYDNFAYQHSVIGSMADLDAASVEDVRQFFKTYYAPNNAVIALVGDLDTKDAAAKVKKYFGGIARQEAAKPVDLSEPEINGERKATIPDKLARLTRIEVSYRIPNLANQDTRALLVAANILGGGESSRIYQKLVKEKQVATSAFAGIDGRAGPSKFSIMAMVQPGKTPEEVEGLLTEEIARLNAEPVSENELKRVRASVRRGSMGPRENVLSMAVSLSDGAALYDDPNRINTEPERRMAVTAADIQKAAKAYLRTSNRVVVVTVPAAGNRGPAPARKQN